MGAVYRRQVKFCATCDRRLDTIAVQEACDAAGHAIELRERPTWWIRYQVRGRPQCVSSNSSRKADAKKLLREREHLADQGAPITVNVGRVTFEDAATALINDYTTNRRRSLRVVELRVKKHLTPVFGHRRLLSITTSDARAFAARRQAAGASNASINRDLICLKRMCSLAMQARSTVLNAAGMASEGWKLLNEAMGDGEPQPQRYAAVRQSSPF